MLFMSGSVGLKTYFIRPLDSMVGCRAVLTREIEMSASLQSTSDRLRQLEKDNVELAAHFAELEELRKMVRDQQNRAMLRAKHRPSTSSGDSSSGFRTSG